MCPPGAQDPARHKEVDSLLGPTTDERFAALVALGKMITDFAPTEAVSFSVVVGALHLLPRLGQAKCSCVCAMREVLAG